MIMVRKILLSQNPQTVSKIDQSIPKLSFFVCVWGGGGGKISFTLSWLIKQNISLLPVCEVTFRYRSVQMVKHHFVI